MGAAREDTTPKSRESYAAVPTRFDIGRKQAYPRLTEFLCTRAAALVQDCSTVMGVLALSSFKNF